MVDIFDNSIRTKSVMAEFYDICGLGCFIRQQIDVKKQCFHVNDLKNYLPAARVPMRSGFAVGLSTDLNRRYLLI